MYIRPKHNIINTYEKGIIEQREHKIINVDTNDAKLQPSDIEKVVQNYALRPHVVKPKMVYISNSTEIGTIYTKAELQLLSEYCKANNLYLFLDGARLGHALTAADNTMTLKDIAAFTDVFYIGGTKNGGLLGEAIVFNHPNLAPEFDYVLKQKGGLLAKGRLLGIQFLELFQDDLYFSLAKHANHMAQKMAFALKEKGYTFLTDSTTNQIFPILTKTLIEKLSQKYSFYEWQTIDADTAAIHLITSWETDENKVAGIIKDVKLFR